MITVTPHVDPAIHVSGLRVNAGRGKQRRCLLEGVSFDATPGQFVAVIGASGCGKSTLIKALAGQLSPSAGSILFSGHRIQDLRSDYPLAVGYLPQFGAFHPELTVKEGLSHALALRLPKSVPEQVRSNWREHIVELARIDSFLDQQYRTLSGGQMRRVALAEELIGDPAFLLLDELTSGLDEHSDREMMTWLRNLAHDHGKTILLVTHATYHLGYCDAVLFLHQGRQVQFAPLPELLGSHGVETVADLFEIYQERGAEPPDAHIETVREIPPQPLKTAHPPSGWSQWPVLFSRQATLFLRDRAQIALHLVLALTFPVLVAVFALKGLPQVRQLTLTLEPNIVETLAEQLLYLRESFQAASLVSGLAMFQVILLTLIGANNGAREIAKERAVLGKELRAGLSPAAYVGTKFVQVAFLSLLQAFWMAWFVKTVCGFPGDLVAQVLILFATTLAMSTICLAISAASSSPERASLLAIYLVGFQLPLSGAALALPDWLSGVCRPFIAAYWGWSGYLRTLGETRHYDIVRQSTDTAVAGYGLSFSVLGVHVLLGLVLAFYFVGRGERK